MTVSCQPCNGLTYMMGKSVPHTCEKECLACKDRAFDSDPSCRIERHTCWAGGCPACNQTGDNHTCGKAEPRCPDGLLPDGIRCPRCGKNRAPSGIGGGTWVHFTPVTPATDSPFPKSRSQIRRLIAQTKSHYEFCVDNDDSCICDQAKDGDKLYVPATPATLTIDEGINALADCMGIASVTYGDAGMKWIKDELHAILESVQRGGRGECLTHDCHASPAWCASCFLETQDDR